MDDGKIIELYFSRDEEAISATAEKYGRLLKHISYNIVASEPDAEECVNDTYFKAWGAIPPEHPHSLRAYLSRIVRNLSINRYNSARARRALNTDILLDELAECIPAECGDPTDDLAIRESISAFLRALPERERDIFVKRYFYACTIENIAQEMKLSLANVKVILHRLRLSLRDYLEREEITI